MKIEHPIKRYLTLVHLYPWCILYPLFFKTWYSGISSRPTMVSNCSILKILQFKTTVHLFDTLILVPCFEKTTDICQPTDIGDLVLQLPCIITWFKVLFDWLYLLFLISHLTFCELNSNLVWIVSRCCWIWKQRHWTMNNTGTCLTSVRMPCPRPAPHGGRTPPPGATQASSTSWMKVKFSYVRNEA